LKDKRRKLADYLIVISSSSSFSSSSSSFADVEPGGGGARYMCRSWLMCERVSLRPRSSTALLHAAPNS